MDRKMKPKKKTKIAPKSATMEEVAGPLVDATLNAVVSKAEENAARDYPDIKNAGLFLVIAFLLGCGFDFLFWKQSLGINFVVFMTLCLFGGLYLLYSNGLQPARNTLWLLLPFVFFAVVTSIRQEPLTIFLSIVFTLFSAGLFASSYLGGRWMEYGLSQYIHKFFMLIRDLISEPVSFVYSTLRQKSNSSTQKNVVAWGVLRGLVIALPIVTFFACLLASGDIVFNQKLGDFLKLFSVENFPEYIFRFALIVICSLFLIGVFLHAALNSQDVTLVGEEKPLIKPFLGFTESAVVFTSVAVLFLIFVIIQFQYFFGGETNIGVAAYSYSEYARRGFNELVTVAFFSLVMILGFGSVTHRETGSQRRVYSWLSVILVALVIVILVSAYQRIGLAIDWHGFSRLRLYTRVFLIWLGILLVTVVVLEILRKERFFAFAALLASMGFACSLILFNVDTAIVRHNVPRVLQRKNLNVSHLASLSVDAVPALASEFYSHKYPEWVHEGLGAALTCYLHKDPDEEVTWDNWSSFNLSRWRSHITLQNVERYLQDYGVNDESSRNLKVRTPSNVWYDCRYFEDSQEE